MKIAVCIKQVPAYSEGNMDPETGLLVRSGLETISNVYDLSALETALRIKEQTGGTVDVFTMGPLRSEAVIREAYAMGADGGYWISDKAFGGADVLATSYTLMQAIKSNEDYELILCGRQTTDGDTGQVSGALAKWLNIPHFSSVTGLVRAEEDRITIEQTWEDEKWIQVIDYPCLLSVERSIFIPRLPSLKLKLQTRKKEVFHIELNNLADCDREHYGLKGSATRVSRIFPPDKTERKEIAYLEGAEAARQIYSQMQKILDSKEARP